jgi:glycosyltransferase involved in cell wall biosynthesis
MIRVAHLLPNMAIGGRERIVADLCQAAAPHDIEPVIITYDAHASNSDEIPLEGVRVVALDRRKPIFSASLKTSLEELAIDVLHAQGHVAAAIARPALGQVPMLATIHVALGTGWRWLIPISRGLRAAAAVTAVSNDLAKRFRPFCRADIKVIPTGVDLDRFRPRTLAESLRHQRPFTLGMAARAHPVKRHRDAIDAVRSLREEGLCFRLKIAGTGPTIDDIRARASGLDVEFLGNTDDMPTFYRSLDAFMLVSDHEGTPAALLEAMSTGLPCIATMVGGIPDIAEQSAILVEKRKPDQIADAITSLMIDEGYRTRLGSMARARAENYSTDRQAQSYAILYNELARRTRLPGNDPFIVTPWPTATNPAAPF